MIAARSSTLLVFLALGLPNVSGAQAVDPSVTLMPPQGKTRVVDFDTDEGTDMSVSVSPDGQWLVFDLLGQVYRLPIAGGRAVNLTENSGGALNFHPAISPDGKRIAFISDRQGQNNVWVMNADGSSPKPVLLDSATRFTEPAWSPDGKSIAAVRAYSTPGRGWHRQYKEMWLLPLGAGKPQSLLAGRLEHYESPRFSPDGKYLYYHVSYSIGDGLGMLLAGHRVQRLELASRTRTNVRTKEPTTLSPAFVAALKQGGYSADLDIDPPAALAPAISPDGRQVAFALEEIGQTFSYRGHEFGPRTGLYVRDLGTGAERKVIAPITKELTQVNTQYYYRVVPSFSWTPDGRSIVIGFGGKLHRVDAASGADTPIPFTARVHRVLSAQPRSTPRIDDRSLTVRFIQWPSGSPDGRRIAFVAAGRIWVSNASGGAPKPLTPADAGTIQLTPAWSPDGKSIAYATWNDRDRGAVWTIAADGGTPAKVTTAAGDYLYPAWSPDGERLAISQSPGANRFAWSGLDADTGWSVVTMPARGGEPVGIPVSTGTLTRSQYAADGTLLVVNTGAGSIPSGTGYPPFPPPDIRDRVSRISAIGTHGAEDRLRIPIRAGDPMISPDGKWVAYEADRSVWVRPLPPKKGNESPFVPIDPNAPDPSRVRIGSAGGVYPRWRGPHQLEFGAGARYVSYDPTTKKSLVVPIHLTLPRPTPTGTIALTNAKIVTMEGPRDETGSKSVIERGTVLVHGTRIACVGACDASKADRTIDVAGTVIVPGFIDLHAHHTSAANGVITPRRWEAAVALAYGLTTVVDPATDARSAFPLAEMIAAGAVVGPRTFSSAEVVIWPGLAWGENQEIFTVRDARFQVGRRLDWGAIEIKNYRQSSRRQHQAIITAARELGITVTSEGGPLFFDVGLTIDGQTGWEHFIAAIPLYQDATTFFGKAGMVYSPTAIVAGHPHGSMQYYRPQQHLLDDPKYNRFIPRAILEAQHSRMKPASVSEVSFPLIAEGVKDMLRAGGYAAVGEHGEQIGIGSHWEIWGYATAMTPYEALRMATFDGAYFVGLHHELGSLAADKLADLIVLDADPLVDIKNTAKIRYVMKDGILYDAKTLDEIWPERHEFGKPPWH